MKINIGRRNKPIKIKLFLGINSSINSHLSWIRYNKISVLISKSEYEKTLSYLNEIKKDKDFPIYFQPIPNANECDNYSIQGLYEYNIHYDVLGYEEHFIIEFNDVNVCEMSEAEVRNIKIRKILDV